MLRIAHIFQAAAYESVPQFNQPQARGQQMAGAAAPNYRQQKRETRKSLVNASLVVNSSNG